MAEVYMRRIARLTADILVYKKRLADDDNELALLI